MLWGFPQNTLLQHITPSGACSMGKRFSKMQVCFCPLLCHEVQLRSLCTLAVPFLPSPQHGVLSCSNPEALPCMLLHPSCCCGAGGPSALHVRSKGKPLDFNSAGAAREGWGQTQRRPVQLRWLLTATQPQAPTALIFSQEAFVSPKSYQQ